MKTTTLKAGLLAGFSLISIAPLAQADDSPWGPFTAGVTLTSDYRFRGVSQSDRDAAIQGWIQYDHESGLFANIWASNIDFNDAGSTTTDDSSIEVDFVVGYNHSFSEETTGTIKAAYYTYPDADLLPGVNRYSYFELIGIVAHDFGKASLSGEIDWSPDYFGETGDAVSLRGGVSVPIMDKFAFMGALSASGNIGYQWIDDNGYYGTPDYLYYDIGASVGWEIFTIDVRWVGTDIAKSECFASVPADRNFCDDGVVVSLSASLPGE